MLFKGKAMLNLKESLISNQTGIKEQHKNRKRRELNTRRKVTATKDRSDDK